MTPELVGRNRGIVVLASYPKSGNTWMRALLAAMQGGSGTVPLDALDGAMVTGTHRSTCPFPFNLLTQSETELWHADACAALRDPRRDFTLQKTHLGLRRDASGNWTFPPEHVLGIVHIVRHPFDVVPSLANHIGRDIPEAVDFLLEPGKVTGGKRGVWIPERWGSWIENTRSWMIDPAPVRILRVRYEDLKRDAARELRRVLDFIGAPDPKPEAVDAAVEAARFERLREQEANSGFRERPPIAGTFFRSGRTGEGWERLDDLQRARIHEACAEAMLALGYSAVAP